MRSLLRPSLAFIHIALTVVFLAGYAARYVHPRHAWWLQIIAVALPFLSVAVLGAAVVALATGSMRLFYLHAVLCVLVVVRFVPIHHVLWSPALPKSDHLSVMTFNAKNKHEVPDSTVRMELERMMAEARSDIVGLQESWARLGSTSYVKAHEPVEALVALGYSTTPVQSAVGIEDVLPVLTRMSSSDHSTVPLGDGEPRTSAAVRTVLRWGSTNVAAYNVHLRSFGPTLRARGRWWRPSYWTRRLAQYRSDYLNRAREAERLKIVLDREELPFLVCGDLNSTPHNWEFGHVARRLQDAFAHAGRGWGATFHARLPLVRIDYVLASRHWEIQRAAVLNTSFSDHRPLTVDVSLRPPREGNSD